MKRVKPRSKHKSQRVKPATKPKLSFFSRLARPLHVFIILILAFGFSTVGKAAEKFKKAVKTKKTNLKATFASLLTARAWGYFKPIWDLKNSDGLPPAAQFDVFAEDTEQRIEKSFRVSPSLKGRVSFWFDVYTRFSSHFKIVHDKDNPEIIYGYLDFRPLYHTLPPRLAARKAHQIEERVIKELKERVAEAMDVSKNKDPRLTEEEKIGIRNLLLRFQIDTPQEAVKPIKRIRAQTGQKDAFLKGIHRSKKLLPQIETFFTDRNLPVALARLPFVESSFNPSAYSKVGASGLWQFMPDTAKLFSPRATKTELRDPVNQSKSAARMFTILRDKFDDWGLAITSYNSGAGRVKRIADRENVATIEALLKIKLGKGSLGFAGANFYSEFLAAVMAEAYQDKIFSSREMHIARLKLPRRIQSLFDHTPVPVTPPQPLVLAPKVIAVKSVRATFKVKRSGKKMTRARKRSNVRSLRAHAKKKQHMKLAAQRVGRTFKRRARSQA